ncbi:FAR-17a/AIG1-like protein [Calycina marina]|uniref:FAR-17a/AIG1-like protein n=1 Tax=Calycina marina TaxID=1763456 RepID=A0A9P7Z0D1_9HELO|nr:FAR-17a/AIG1-like protein [Calycina marina]
METVTNSITSRHPLQRMQSPGRGISALLHTLGLISFSLSYKYLFDFPSMINDSYGWHFQYLTIIGLTIAALTFAFGLLADITLSSSLFRIKNTLAMCSAPLEVLISVLYWGISAVDKSLLVPPEIELSPWADVGFHAMPSILLAIDLLFLSPPWSIKAAPAMALSFTLAVSYWAWVEQCFRNNGFYPYPIFGQLDTTQRAALFTGAAALMTGSTTVLQKAYQSFNGIEQRKGRATPANMKGQ